MDQSYIHFNPTISKDYAAAWINRLRKFLLSQDLKVIVILALIVAAISFPIYYYRINYPVDSDFGLHMLYTRYMIRDEFNRIPNYTLAHPGLQLILTTSYWLTMRKLPIGFMHAAWMSVAQIVTAVVLYFWLEGGEQKNIRRRLRALFAVTLTMIAPITLLALHDGYFYFGYITLVNFHNPTVILVRPLALLSFILIVSSMEKQSSSKSILFHAGLVFLSALIKPSYLICILPAFILLSAWQFIHHKHVDMRMLVLGFLIPAVFVLGVQFSITYFTDGEEGGISILPLEVESHFSGYLLPKFLLSILFPLIVLVFNLHALRQNNSIKLAWVGFLFGVAQMYLLAESGDRLYDGNFRWGAQIMSFLLFSASVRWIMSALCGNEVSWRYSKWPITLAYVAHLLAGITYYVRSFILTTYF